MNKLELWLSGNYNLDAYLLEIYKSFENYTMELDKERDFPRQIDILK